MNRFSEISIWGGGLYGVLLTYCIAKRISEKNTNVKIRLIDKGQKLLESWNHINIDGFKLNNGFHGIEMPRSKKTFQILCDLLGIITLIFTSK